MPNRTTNATHTTTTPPPGTSSPAAATPPLLGIIMQIERHFPWRSPDCCSKALVARSRRRRRRDDLAATVAATLTPTCAADPESNASHKNLSRHTPPRPASTFFSAVSQALTPAAATAYIAAALLVLSTCCVCAASPCDSHSWWDPMKDKCIPCTACQDDMIPLRPCQLHRDTICGSIYDLKIDWVVLAKTEPNWKERRKSEETDYNLEQHLTHEELQQLHDEALPLDWQTTALFMAVLACLLFFIVAACILIHHMRQWRRMERRLDQDVEELSTKLMAKLAEVQSLEGGTFFIGNADALRVPSTFQPQHVLLPEKPAKHSDRRIMKTLQPGNVYIEESSSKG